MHISWWTYRDFKSFTFLMWQLEQGNTKIRIARRMWFESIKIKEMPFRSGRSIDAVLLPYKGRRVFGQIARLGDLHFVHKFPDTYVGVTLD
jgi:hypothetical protein